MSGAPDSTSGRASTGPARPRTARSVVAGCCAAVLVLGGCTSTSGLRGPSAAAGSPERAAAELATALAKKDVSAVEFVGAAGPEVNRELSELVRGMGPLRPAVEVGDVDDQSDGATATLTYRWTFPGVPRTWSYATTAQLVDEAGRWKTRWQPSLLQPDLTATTRLTQARAAAPRGRVLGENGAVLVEERPVVRYGIDKAGVSRELQAASARKLARLLDIDAGAYVAKVKDAGPEAFVEALTLRATDKARPDNDVVFAIRGALPIEDEQMLAPSRDFARGLLGLVGQASKEIVDASDGAVVGGDQVGLSGLQRRYDKQLRGTPGVEVKIVAQTPTASPSPAPSPSPSPPPAAAERTVFMAAATAGEDLQLTMSLRQQQAAEKVLARTKPASALVAVRPSSGEVLVAANGPGAGDQSVANVGQYPPGSTFKVATSLALLRAGLTPDSEVSCPATVTVDGRRFKNYSDYPTSALGSIPLRTAVAQSCNTAFIGQRGKLRGGDLAQAAASLGLGVDYDVGFPSFFGSVPEERSATGEAASLIGQAKVQASPLAMAGVAASVAAGRTVVPYLLADSKPASTAQPLTAVEAKQLQDLMGAVVDEGSGRFLRSLEPPDVLAKTGTAEYGTRTPPRTHAWMIAAQGDLAVAVFVAEGESGSKTAGPLLERYLEAVAEDG